MSWGAMVMAWIALVSWTGKKPFGISTYWNAGQHEGHQSDDQGDALVVEHPSQSAIVFADDPIENALGGKIEAVARVLGPMPHDQRTHHRHQGQRYDRRQHDRHCEGDREFVKQAPDDVAHEEQGNQDRDQRNGQRDDGESELA